MSKSREGRHTAMASTWLLRRGLCQTREAAVKLVQRGRVLVDGKVARTRVGYHQPKTVALLEE